jgi:hypothetical protein
VSVSILQTLALMPSGAQGQVLSVDQLAAYLRQYHYQNEPERRREAQHRLRDELYMDGGTAAMEMLIDQVRALQQRGEADR